MTSAGSITSLTTNSLMENSKDKFSLTNIVDQVENSFSDLGQNFQDFFTQAKDNNENNLVENLASTTSDDANNMQSGLLSSLGLGFLSTVVDTNIGDMPLAENMTSFEQIQNNLLILLQTSALKENTQQVEQSEDHIEKVNDVKEAVQSSQDLPIFDYSQAEQYVFGANGIELNDAFDTVNILQHVPIVSSIYQESSGQNISAIAKLGGGYLYGGVIGLGYAALDLAVEGFSGKSIGDSIVSFSFSDFFFGTDTEEVSPIGYLTKYRDDIYINPSKLKNITKL